MLKGTWPIFFGMFALFLWILYALLALSTTSPTWVPFSVRLPAEDTTTTVLARRGQFGDAFGAFNALVSTFALIGLFYTIRSQQLQMEAQAKWSKSSEQLNRQQQFQEQYYRAVDAYRELLSEISYSCEGESESAVNGRVALWKIWRDQMIGSLASPAGTSFDLAIQVQIDAYTNEGLGSWNTNDDAAAAIQRMLHDLLANPQQHGEVVERIGAAWSGVYSMHRFQLDSLFRSWYTAYRVLGTAGNYEIEEDSVRLYSAIFRAQLSWIELAFLLVNQSGLPGNPTFPRSCYFSNEYAMFDNLDITHDAVVGVLYQTASAAPVISDRESAMLCGKAFS